MNNSKNKLKFKNSRGITLIALVITIIVLIILAGVIINLILGKNGIITNANEAKENTELAKIEEETALNEVVQYMENYVGTSGAGSTIKKDENGVEEGKSGYLGSGYDDPYIPVGFSHIGTEGWNDGFRISDTGDETGNIFVWVPCVTDQRKVKAGDNVQTFQKTTTGKYNNISLVLSPTDTTITDKDPTNAIKTSVGTYGGFYIAAYEAGIEGTTENYSLSPKTSINVKPLSQGGKGVWNYIIRGHALLVAKSMVNTTDGVKSGLISGECWDTTLQWMVNSSSNKDNQPNAGYDINSEGKGWYKDTPANGTRHTTGNYAVNNIYDMAGNVYEWTTENCMKNNSSTIYLVVRGGSYNISGSSGPAAKRLNNNEVASDGIGFRVVLYKVDSNS